MTGLRALLTRHPSLAAIIVAAALLLRLAVPAGFMPVADHGRILIAICSGTGPATRMIAMPGMAHHDEGGAAKSPCAFADLALPALGGADPIRLAELLAFILVAALLLAVAVPAAPAPRLRPPPTGPPATA